MKDEKSKDKRIKKTLNICIYIMYIEGGKNEVYII